MMTTGAVYAILLAQHDHVHAGATEAGVDLIVHRIAPVVAPIDWILAPPRARLHPTVVA